MSDDLAKVYARRKQQREAMRQRERAYTTAATGNVAKAVDYALSKPAKMLEKGLMGEGGSYYSEGDKIHWPSVTGLREPETLTKERAESLSEGTRAVLDPYNALGLGLLTKGVQGVKSTAKAADNFFGANAGRGGAIASLSNYIDNWYGPTGVNTKTDEVISSLTKVDADRVRAARQKVSGAFNWGVKSATDAVQYILSPKARAMYKEMGITPGSQRHVARALADEALHKATAQVQYTSHIGKQAGRQGPIAAEIKTIMEKSGVTDYFAYSPGSYASAIKEGQFYPTSGGRKTSMGANDLDIIENHFGSVWKAPDPKGADVPFKDAEGTILLIKAPGLGTKTGDHYTDLMLAGGFAGDMSRSFQKHNNKPSLEQLWTDLKKVSDKNQKYNDTKKRHEPKRWTLTANSDTLEKAQKNGIWLSNSKKGRAYTEGGINYIVKVQPNGNIFGVMSDEHNFFENIAGKGDEIARKATGREQGANLISKFEDVLPHRLVAVTPPMQANIFNLKNKKLGGESRKLENVSTGKGAVSRGDLEAYMAAKPTPQGLQVERQRNRAVAEAATGAGLLTLPDED